METNDDTGAFHYDTAMDSVAPEESSEMYSSAPKGNEQSPNDLYDLSGDQRHIAEDNFVSNVTDQQMYQQQEEVGRNNEEYAANDPNMDAYMMEQEHNQYSDYPSQYQEGQYVNSEQFDVIAEQMDNNQTVSDVARSNTETLH